MYMAIVDSGPRYPNEQEVIWRIYQMPERN